MAALLTPMGCQVQVKINDSTTEKTYSKTYSDCKTDATGDQVLAFANAISPIFQATATPEPPILVEKNKVTEGM